jgi:hypothetical protein
MTLIEISKLAARTLVGMARDGNLAPGHIWCAIKGAETYLIAAASGDQARSIDAQKRVALCDSCPLCTYEPKPMAGGVAMYCGDAFVCTEPPGPCGCLVGVMVNGKPLPGGKVMVASEACPCDRWARVRPEGYNPDRSHG